MKLWEFLALLVVAFVCMFVVAAMLVLPILARVAFYSGDTDSAIRRMSETVMIDSAFTAIGFPSWESGARTTRGYFYDQKHEYDNEVDDLNSAIRLVPGNADARNALAWILATCPDAKYRNGERAIESATKACALTNWESPNYVDTLAAAYAENQQFKDAVEWQQKALAISDPPLPGMKDRLELYKKHEPYREK